MSATPRGTKRRINIKVVGSPYGWTVPATVYGHWGVHDCGLFEAKFVVTHVPTGYCLPEPFARAKAAHRLARWMEAEGGDYLTIDSEASPKVKVVEGVRPMVAAAVAAGVAPEVWRQWLARAEEE